GGRFWFSSELNALLEDPSLDRELDMGALVDFLTIAYVPAPSSIFRAIRKLPPAHLLVWEKGRSRIERYWSAEREPKWIAGEILLDPSALRRGYFREEGVRTLLEDHAAGREDHGFLIWSLLVLELWHRHVLESRERPSWTEAAA
ncbi:MAG: asparagine synthase-related protein, partial [bacterium]